MVFVYYHQEDIEIKDGRNKNVLEKRLIDLGWSKLRWCPGTEQGIEWVLIGRPPNYKGEISDYWEKAIKTLISPKDSENNSCKIMVRDFLIGPVFDSKEGVGWGNGSKESYNKLEHNKYSNTSYPNLTRV